MHLNLNNFASFLALVCSFVENAEIKINEVKLERQKKMSSTETVFSSFPASSAIHCIALCNINDECLHGTFDEEGAWCYLYSNQNPSIEDNINSLVFTTCVTKDVVADLTTYDDQITVVGALSTFPSDRYLSFDVKSCPPISIQFEGETGERFYIDIGRPNASRSRINYAEVYYRRDFVHNDPLLTCDSVTSFWITWFGDVIKVGKGDIIGNDKFMEMQVAGIITPRKLLRVKTGMVTAEWSFSMNRVFM